jgi:hypothetical protein
MKRRKVKENPLKLQLIAFAENLEKYVKANEQLVKDLQGYAEKK